MKSTRREINEEEMEMFFIVSKENPKEFLKDLDPKADHLFLQEEMDGASMFTREEADGIVNNNPDEYTAIAVKQIFDSNEYDIEISK